MSTTPTDAATSVRREIFVAVPVERAFAVFTEQFDRIKPRDHSLLDVPVVETVLEPRVGGHIYDRGEDGSECHWSRVLAFEPPHRLVFSWDIGADWTLESDPARTSEVEVTFAPEADGTRVVLEHRHLDRHGDGWTAMGQAVGTDQGWPLYLQRFADVVGG
ncbi:MAG TPA: SRPBCC family protein [Nocardioides sp.]|nr:SRPBCC family protein [Nocardioides sp.]